ncbi:FadR family transcriptional regulator [Geobacter sulfurreducens]|uniref:Pyruvate dehydrogenase complex repressor n=1 Tax=Geobacter sulfurreducens (strain ATCC 51573 / DSM 12127 / PCA) TaxID=243231 RepID=Q74CP7_GEOSL|nr:FadR/GntR family transcriptional regulator [Geobacter sulfurreducens]BET58019.1 FadR/GntR family transcriptional regulator [Geobacter sp. 60473]AAR35000.1 helix-turn-helix transcriptional regulator, GntR family [Geobacter sulfurreducens PCA]ADI84460.1 helix-turn-helix transcriptional regulator, GntR family [Geobacter sulfurreducens KN400]AJY71494.1 GntR family transcriptional regulator [Geobacter sulfurreducens]QVW36789.1 FadR family transcriptional regulator [Geobacter sulfurreducens]
MNFKPIKPKKISTQIAEQIRSSILAGEFTPGEKLPPERELAEMFGVSRPSVREALNILAAAGLVESYQGGGTIVKSLMDAASGPPLSEIIKVEQERALDVIEVRKCMEAWTAYYAAQRALPDDVRKLEGIVWNMEANLNGLKPSEDLDANFHIVIARSTHNVVWLHLMQTIFEAMKEFQRSVWRAVYLTEEDHRTLFAHHKAIFEAIRDKDCERARNAMLGHLTFAEKRSSIYVNQSRQDR